ncbi:ABC transporter ATP-binding protein [Eubacterium barkeri]|uniref:ABC-2 type transport system ATP-binding protein n=1 Tax=Eubacterium barkeri TaxID=1528 RepID=A0A1H3H855_EUBBA|nr:ABC transporter ATP-binding protein [Eubacterium barkeri]SDY11078.1 ABC-2 type transport system ATP-binding protein [Eubacterium barkeri]
MLTIENLSKTYGNKSQKAVDDLCFTVRDGEIFGFVGPNGAGKTTTIKMIASLLSPDTGRIIIDGVDNQQDPMGAKEKFSYVPDNPELFEKIRGNEYLRFMADVYRVPDGEFKERAARYLDIFDLKGDVAAPIAAYSHGMKQKIALIGALIHNPRLFILDEPMVGLDPKSSFELKKIMAELCAQGHSVFFSTHVLDVAEKICDRIAIIHHGRLIALGTMDEIRGGAGKDESLEEIFLELTE